MKEHQISKDDTMNTKVVAIAAVAILVVAGVGVAIALNSGKSSPFTPESYPESFLTVLGNAEPDNVIDSKDVAKIKAVVDENKSVDYKDYYMYDANHDGSINQDDVTKVEAIIAALASADPSKGDSWKDVGKVYYVNVDKEIKAYDMTKSNYVITLIAPPLDSVLAMGGKDLVKGFDSRIEKTGKYYPEYCKTLDFSNPYLVGSCNDPDTEVISRAANDLGSITVVCGTKASYGANMESTFEGTNVQVIRIASWEYGDTMYGFMTLGFLLKKNAEAKDYFDKYKALEKQIADFIETVPANKKVGAAVAYGYDMASNQVKLLGVGTGEYANLMALKPYDSAEDFLGGKVTEGHGNQINGEDISTMVQQCQLKKIIFLIGTPFQVKTAEGDAESTQTKIKAFYDHWNTTFGLDTIKAANPGFEWAIAGYSFSSGVSEVLNRLVLSYYLYTDEFVTTFGAGDAGAARTFISEKINWYCESIGIDEVWGFTGDNTTHLGMNLLYCGVDDDRNIMNGRESGSWSPA